MGVLNLFLEREGVNLDQALHWAAAHGDEDIVKMFLERADVDLNQIPTGYSDTPLSQAAKSGQERVVSWILQREDVNPNIADLRDGRTPLSHAASRGHEGIVKMLLDLDDIRIDIRDHKNQTAYSLALSEGHDKIARMISEQAASMSDAVYPGSQESLPWSAGAREQFTAEMELRDDHSNATTANLSGEPTSPPGDPNALEELSDWEGYFPGSADSIIPSTELPCPPQLPSSWPLKFQYSRRQTATHPNDTPSTVSIAANKYFITASCVCILAFLLYILPLFVTR